MSRPIVLFCIIMALLFASCKKNMDVTDGSPGGTDKVSAIPGTFKKQVTINETGGTGKIIVMVSGNDEQAVKEVAAAEFSTVEPQGLRNLPAAAKPQPLAQPLVKPDLQKAVYLTVTAVEGSSISKNTPWVWFRLTAQAGLLNPQLLISADLDPGLFRLRRNLLSSFSWFGVSAYAKQAGNVIEYFGAPWGDTGFPYQNTSSDPNGVFCQRLYTVLSITTVNQQWMAFQAYAWPL